jgi:hypothetical protein
VQDHVAGHRALRGQGAGRPPGWSLREDSLVQLGEGAAGVDAQLLTQVPPDPGVDRQRLGLPTQALRRTHAQDRRCLVEWVARHQLEGEVVRFVGVCFGVVEQ